MHPELHKVTQDELPALREWLAQYMPNSCKIYGAVCNEIDGMWKGPTYYTLGWPGILAVGDGLADPNRSYAAEYFNFLRHTCVYSPSPDHLETLLTHPDFLDWTKPIVFTAVCHDNTDVIQRVSDATGTRYNSRKVNYLMAAEPGEIKPLPIPEGLELRSLDPALHADYVTTHWPLRRNHAMVYVQKLLESGPSCGLFDRNGSCLAWELTSEYRFGALLQVRDTAQGRGFGSCVASHLAQMHFKENRPIMAGVYVENQASIRAHERIGYKAIGYVNWFYHKMSDVQLVGPNHIR